jgi:hypothetical protein
MKKILFILITFSTFTNFAQTTEKPNEIKLNALNMIAFKWLDLTYERALNDESSLGVSFLSRLSDKQLDQEFARKYSVTPYYRYYFSNTDGIALFGEAFSKINGGLIRSKTEVEGVFKYEDYSDLAFGLGLGVKYYSEGGFVTEIYAGAGRNLFTETAPTVVTRFGASLGYKF